MYRMGFTKRKGCSTKKLMVHNFDELKEQFLNDINAVVTMEDIPDDLILNWDHIAISIVPVSSWTMSQKGEKRVEIVGLDDKRQITAVLCGTLSGKILPLQLIYQGKTFACLPKVKLPKDLRSYLLELFVLRSYLMELFVFQRQKSKETGCCHEETLQTVCSVVVKMYHK